MNKISLLAVVLAVSASPAIAQQCPLTITGVLGSNSAGFPGTSGTQNARLNRNGIASTCTTPKTCAIFAAGTFPYDSYTIPNPNPGASCVTAQLEVIDQAGCNLQMNGYLGAFDNTNICTNYLADAGFSSGSPPSLTSWSENVPVGGNLTLVVHSTTDSAGAGCNYRITFTGAPGNCVPVTLQKFSVE